MGGEGRGVYPILTVCRHAPSSPSCISSASTCPPARSEWSQRASAARHGLESLLLSCVSSPPPLPLPTSGGVGEGKRRERAEEGRGREREGDRRGGKAEEGKGWESRGRERGKERAEGGREREEEGKRKEDGTQYVTRFAFTAVPIHPVHTVSCQPSEES